MHELFITSLAFHPQTNKVKHVREAANGLKCKCICEECDGDLEAVQSKIPGRKWYFRHYNKSNCTGSFESLLHKYAKQVIEASNSIVRTKSQRIDYLNAISEESVNPYRPDITLTLENGEQVYIEIFVSSAVKEVKKDFFVSNSYKSFEINLSDIKERNKLVDLNHLNDRILNNHRNRNSLYWPQEITSKEPNSAKGLWAAIIGAVLILIYCTFKWRRKGKKRY